MTTQPLGPWSTPEQLARDGGGKAANLARIAALHFAVPDWFCVAAPLFDAVRETLALEALRHASADDEAAAQAIALRLAEAELPGDLRDVLCTGLDRLALHSVPIAVRSSGLEEDSERHSFAGQFASELYQLGVDQAIVAVRRCWASAYSARNLAYRRSAGLSGSPPRMAVIIQRMVDASVAGVAFSRDPLAPLNHDHAIIESAWGLGERLVSGVADGDRYVVHRETRTINATIARKDHVVVRSARGGTEVVSLEHARATQPSLDDAQVRVVANAALRLERELGSPQDCEWAFAHDALWILQTRPITTLPPDTRLSSRFAGRHAVIWDNSNIVESYAGVTTPLTFSHVSRCYREVYIQFCRVMGVSEAAIAAEEPMFRNMLGLVRGRIYYNLANWYRLLALLPGVGRSRGFMETMLGVKQSLTPELAAELDRALVMPPLPWWRRVATALTTGLRLVQSQRLNRAFLARMASIVVPLQKEDLRGRDLGELLRLYEALDRDILKQWRAPIVTDFRCLLAFGLLKSLTARWFDDADLASLQNDLLCGDGNLKSMEPTLRLVAIAEFIDRGDAALRARVVAATPAELRQLLALKENSGVATMFDAFLVDFGFRCADELKLESPDLHDDPTFALSAIQSYLRSGSSATLAHSSAECIRAAAEARVRVTLSRPRAWLYQVVLGWARRAVRDRELLRFERTRVFGVTRRLFRAVGAALAGLGAINDAEDVFYLTVEELFGYHEGRALTSDFRPLVTARRDAFREFRRTPAPPDRFLTRGAASAMMASPAGLAASDLLAHGESGADDSGLLRGTPCSPGVVEGVIRIATCIDDARGISGEILVTERTDPGWVPLFPSCLGLIVARGSLLSHSAVVAREMGLPTIVGVSGRALDRLRTGMRVRMDATRGEIRVL